MATISHSDLAPAEKVHYSLAGEDGEFDLTAKGSYETEDEQTLANARAHPWLKVEAPVADDDGPVDPALEVRFPAVAIDAGLDQKKVEFEGPDDNIAETLAAEEAQADEPIVVDDPADDPVPAEEKE